MALSERDPANDPSNENERHHAEQAQHPEASEPQDLLPYYLASRFPNESAAGRAYFRLQDLVLRTPDADLSAFRFQLSRISHVAVVGTPPPESLEARIKRVLSAGDFVTLPAEVLVALLQRRIQASQEAGWVERHFRPGQPL